MSDVISEKKVVEKKKQGCPICGNKLIIVPTTRC